MSCSIISVLFLGETWDYIYFSEARQPGTIQALTHAENSSTWWCVLWRQVGMSEFCNSVCAELTKRQKNCEILQVLFSNMDLSSAMTADTLTQPAQSMSVYKVIK